MLAAMDPQRHRVYSEPGPPAHVLLQWKNREKEDPEKTDQFHLPQKHVLTDSQAVVLLQHVLYLMRRSPNQSNETVVFIKLQSTMTRYLPLVRQAFPEVPWMFLYRDCVQIIMSYLYDDDDDDDGGDNTNHGGRSPSRSDRYDYARRAYCQGGALRGLPPLRHPPGYIQEIVQRHIIIARTTNTTEIETRSSDKNHNNTYRLSYEDYCAANLASVTEPVLEYFNDTTAASITTKKGFVLNYNKVSQHVVEHWIQYWGLSIGPVERQRMEQISRQYSKQTKTRRQRRQQRYKTRIQGDQNENHGGTQKKDTAHLLFVNDSWIKESKAWDRVRTAASVFLQASYNQLEQLSATMMTTTAAVALSDNVAE
ncbi:hypothetical protein ACA910_003042 [Epithemia clementina (nom. ined.)]